MKLTFCERGTASVEIVVMLPVFVLLFLGSIHVHKLTVSRMQAASAARSCALYFAAQGCTEAARKHPICEGVVASTRDSLSSEEASRETQEHNSILENVGDWPLLGPLIQGLFGQGALASATREVPGFMSAEPRQVRGNFYLVCNTISESWSDKGADFMCGAADKLQVKGAIGALGLCK